eukprot:701771-Rhodomonas_salina.1
MHGVQCKHNKLYSDCEDCRALLCEHNILFNQCAECLPRAQDMSPELGGRISHETSPELLGAAGGPRG